MPGGAFAGNEQAGAAFRALIEALQKQEQEAQEAAA
jgi:hypothetical protein